MRKLLSKAKIPGSIYWDCQVQYEGGVVGHAVLEESEVLKIAFEAELAIMVTDKIRLKSLLIDLDNLLIAVYHDAIEYADN